MRRPIPPDGDRCTATARSAGQRCRNAAYGPSRLCKSHRLHPPRPARPDPTLLAELGAFRLDVAREIRVQLRENADGEEYVSVRLFIGEAPTRRVLYLSPRDLDGFALALYDAGERLQEVTA